MSNDLLKYRKQNETEREWQLKKLFIETFISKYDEDRLLCLAQCYVNVQTMGCRYSNKIMQHIKELTGDFELTVKENKISYQPQQQQKQQQQPRQQYQQQNQKQFNNNNNNNSKPADSQTRPKQKLINKTQFYDDQEQQFANSTPRPKIQILSRNTKTNEMHQNQQQTVSLSSLSTSPYKNAVLNQIQSKPSKPNLMGTKNSSFSSAPTPSVPASTTELAPAASQVPIPFGLSSAQEHAPTRNVLLNFLTNSQNTPIPVQNPVPNPLSILIGSQPNLNQQTPLIDDQKFVRLNKINKLRDILRGENYVPVNDNFDLIDHFDQVCKQNSIDLKYIQFQLPDNNNVLYYGELYIESFRLVHETHKKRKKCKYYAYKNALEILTSRSELAVKVASANKSRDPNLVTLDGSSNVNFEYELYRLDSNQDLNKTTKSATNEQSLVDLNALLKSMILPKESSFFAVTNNLSSVVFNSNANNNNNTGVTVNESQNNDDSKESQLEFDEDNEDDDDENKTQNIDRKSRIKQNLTNFCLFIPSSSGLMSNDKIDSSNLDQFLHEKNSLNILNQSCIKSSCNLEFELKLKSANSKSTKTIISGDRIQIESDNDEEDQAASNENRKFKCKCLINGVKIASAHANNKTDSKRLAALKAIKYLFKLFPAIRETSYQSINTGDLKGINSSVAPSPKYIKITKEELFGLMTPAIFESPLNSLSTTDCFSSLNSQLGNKLLKKMGWKGEGFGLGKDQQGIKQAIDIQDTSRTRLGFGFKYNFCDDYDQELNELDGLETINNISKIDLNDFDSSKTNSIKKVNNLPMQINNQFNPRNKTKLNEFLNNIRKLMNNFVSSQTEQDIVFDKSLTVEERKLIHREAHKFGLKTRSEGNGINRFLVVRRKQTSGEILESVLKNGGGINKYTIISRGDL